MKPTTLQKEQMKSTKTVKISFHRILKSEP